MSAILAWPASARLFIPQCLVDPDTLQAPIDPSGSHERRSHTSTSSALKERQA